MSEQIHKEQPNYYYTRILMAAGTDAPPFTMAYKTKPAKIVAILREDTVSAVMICDGHPHQFIIKLKSVGCFLENEMEKKEKAFQHLTSLLLNKIVTLRCYIHTSFNELICSLRLEGKDVLRELLDQGALSPFSHSAHMLYYPPIGMAPLVSTPSDPLNR